MNNFDKWEKTHSTENLHSFNFVNYDVLTDKLANEIPAAVRGYVVNSWYNHWTSIIIENICRSHKTVVPGLGKIKNVDFFINNIPFDLKTTYFPAEYVKLKLKEAGQPDDAKFLKTNAKRLGISFSSTSDPAYEILEKIGTMITPDALDVIAEYHKRHNGIIDSVVQNPRAFVKWLYENQGEMRFSPENRFFSF